MTGSAGEAAGGAAGARGAPRGRVVVVSGPSGSGKTSVVAELVRDARFRRLVTATTRAPRAGEQHGRDYWFLSEEEFRRGIAEGRFLEWAEVYGRLYGSPREPVERAVAEGWNIVLNIDVQGAARLREQGVDGVYVFLRPPSLAELERRLRGRRTDDDATIARRLATAEREMAEAPRYDAVVVNDELVRAADEVRRIALARGAGPEARASGEGGAGAGAARGAAHEAARGAEAAS